MKIKYLPFLFSSSIFASIYGYHPESPLYLGGGFNPFKPTSNPLRCMIHNGEESLDGNVAVRTEASIRLIKSREDLYRSTSFSASMSANFAFGNMSGSVSSIDEFKFKENSLTWLLLFKTDYGKFGLKNLRLRPEYRGRSLEELQGPCGTEIVSSVRKGVMAYALVTATELSKEKKEEFESKFSGKAKGTFWSADMDVQFQSILNSSLATQYFDVKLEALGGFGIVELTGLLSSEGNQMVDYTKVPSVLKQYIEGLTPQNATVIKHYTTKLKHFLPGTPILESDFAHRQVENLYFKYLNFQDEKRKAEEVLIALRDASDAEIEELRTAIGQCEEGMDAVSQVAQDYLAGRRFDCPMPKNQVPYVDFYKYGEDRPYFAIEHYCDHEDCDSYRKVSSRQKKVGTSIVYEVQDLEAGHCAECDRKKVTRLCFRNCEAKVKHENLARRFVEFPKIIASNDNMYFFPEIEEIKRMRITTETKK